MTSAIDQLRRGTRAAGERLPRREQVSNLEHLISREAFEHAEESGMTQAKRTTTEELVQGGGVCAADAAPARNLGPVPVIEDDTQLSLALVWLSWLTSRRKTVEARLEGQIRLLRSMAAEDLRITIEGVTQTFEEYFAALETAILDFIEEHQERLFAAGQTLRFPAGEVKRAKSRLGIEFTKSKQEAEQKVLDSLEQDVAELACGIDGFLPWLKVSVSLDVEGIKRALKAEEIGKSDLRKRGMKARGLDPNDVTLAVKPHDYAQLHTA